MIPVTATRLIQISPADFLAPMGPGDAEAHWKYCKTVSGVAKKSVLIHQYAI